jgi:uncharacterized protein YheU (UPF0270 family)
MAQKKHAQAIEVPYTSLQPATLRAVIEEFVTRHTTDYGERERSLDERCDPTARAGRGQRRVRWRNGQGEHRRGTMRCHSA